MEKGISGNPGDPKLPDVGKSINETTQKKVEEAVGVLTAQNDLRAEAQQENPTPMPSSAVAGEKIKAIVTDNPKARFKVDPRTSAKIDLPIPLLPSIKLE